MLRRLFLRRASTHNAAAALNAVGEEASVLEGRFSHHNLSYSKIYELERASRECVLTQNGVAGINGTRPSRSEPFVVKDKSTRDEIWWQNNREMTEDEFERVRRKTADRLEDADEVFVHDGFAGSDKESQLSLRVVSTKVWQHHFAKNMLVRRNARNFEPDFTVVQAPSGGDDRGFVALNLAKRMAIIGGDDTFSKNEDLKKCVFALMQYVQPKKNVSALRCAANVGEQGDVALIFGRDKATWASSETRTVVGDDEHCWGQKGISNVEGGCYATVDRSGERSLYDPIKRNALLENVDNSSETRVSYPVTHLPNRVCKGIAGHPSKIIFLAEDATSVLPAVSRLDPQQAEYYYLNGFTTSESDKTYSATHATFSPLHPFKHAKLLGDKMRKHNVQAFLINTGFAGGKKIPVETTRAIIDAIYDGALDHENFTHHPVLNLSMPNLVLCADRDTLIPRSILHPWEAWERREDYEAAADKLARSFVENFDRLAAARPEDAAYKRILAKCGPSSSLTAFSNS